MKNIFLQNAHTLLVELKAPLLYKDWRDSLTVIGGIFYLNDEILQDAGSIVKSELQAYNYWLYKVLKIE
jgi:hypothetical protein